ncbi:asparaginase [Pigmentiphaga soli]|uniref:Asparaginase n=1 Tax=Pigmentiphaga soli TaxID=1007095 RepID=A0ABP8H804_9BURK
MTLPRLRLIATGGTIAGVADSADLASAYRAAALGPDALRAAVPALAQVARIDTETAAAIDSKNATPTFWQHLAGRVQAAADDPEVDGVVVTHGTDTLEESAYYLQLVLKSDKPVVFVGAMRPATSLSADGPLNLLNAVRVAARADAGGRGVLVALNHLVHGAGEAAKADTLRPDSFVSQPAGPLGLVQDDRVVWLARTERAHTMATPFRADSPLRPVDILPSYPGVSPMWVQAAVASGAAGIVWAGTGNGSVPAAIEPALAAAAAKGIAVIRAARVGGYVMPRADDAAHGFVAAGRLSPFKARVLAMLALGAGWRGERLREAFERF